MLFSVRFPNHSPNESWAVTSMLFIVPVPTVTSVHVTLVCTFSPPLSPWFFPFPQFPVSLAPWSLECFLPFHCAPMLPRPSHFRGPSGSVSFAARSPGVRTLGRSQHPERPPLPLEPRPAFAAAPRPVPALAHRHLDGQVCVLFSSRRFRRTWLLRRTSRHPRLPRQRPRERPLGGSGVDASGWSVTKSTGLCAF